jgi:hypothetical protein
MSEVMLAIRMNDWEAYDQDFQINCSLKIALLPKKKDEFIRAFQPFNDIGREYLGTY